MKNRNNGIKRAAVILLSAALLFANIPARAVFAADIKPAKGTDSRRAVGEPVFPITDAYDFLEFAQLCKNDLYSYGKIFTLETDLDLTGTGLECVPYFAGTLEGNGHTISNLKLSRKGSDYGLFRYIGKSGTVRNLTVTGEISMDGTGENIGGIAGVNFGIIDGCTFNGTVSGKASTGGIAGYNKADGIIMSCTATGVVTATNSTGGICGTNKGIIQQCTNRSTINAEDLKTTLDLNGVDLGTLNVTQNVVTRNHTGGIAGTSSGTIASCSNMGNIGFAHVGYNVGGIAGRQSGTLVGCTNGGTVLGRKDVGGIAGQAEPFRESEYLSDHLEKLRDDFSGINHLVIQMSDALSTTSSETKDYTQALQRQYEDTISSLNDEVNALKDTVSENNANTRDYINRISEAISSLGSLGNDTVKRVTDSIQSNAQNAVNKVKDKIDKIIDKATETESTEEETESSGPQQEETESSGSREEDSGSSSEESGEEPESSSSVKEDTSDDGSVKDESGPEKDSAGDDRNENSYAPEEREQEPADDAAEKVTREENGKEVSSRYFGFDQVKQKDGEEEKEEFTLPIELPTEFPTLPTETPDLPDKGEIESKVDEILHDDPIQMEHDGEIDKNLDRMHGELTSISDNIRNLESTLSGTGESLTNTASNISGELTDQSRESGNTIDSMTESIDSGIQSVTGKLNAIMNTSQRMTDTVSADIDILMGNGNALLDISSEKVTDKTLGVISGCVNRGTIEADINVGGIAGMMNVEYDIDPELDLDLEKFTDVAVRSTTNDVLLHCINYGGVSAKKNNCGGIAGCSELGLIHDCENYGAVMSAGGSRIGGIAGMSASRINESSAFCNLEGKTSLGGIAGEGFDISGCRAMCSITCENGEKTGSIAGYVDPEATVAANFFVSDIWGGVDNINYIGKAEACSYDQMMRQDGIPDGFHMVTVTFEKDGNAAGTLRIPYGGTVMKKDVPKIPAAEDCYLKWDIDFPVEDVRENIRITAEDIRWTKSLAAGAATENGKSDFLVEGDFYEDSVLNVRKTEAPQNGSMIACYAYGWSIDNRPEERAEYLLHFRIPDETESIEVLTQRDGKWEKAEIQEDGSYVTVLVPYGAKFAVYAAERGSIFWYLAAGGAAAVLLIFGAWKKKKERKCMKKGNSA